MLKSKFKGGIIWLVILIVLFSTSLPANGLAQTTTDPVVELPGTVSPDLGAPASPTPGKTAPTGKDPASVVIVLTPRNEGAFKALAESVSDPVSPRYRQPITDSEYRHNYAPDPATVSDLKNYFSGLGLSLDFESTSELMFRFTGSQGQLDRVFGTSSQYRTDASGESGLINVTPLKLPLSLVKTIKGVMGFDKLHAAHTDQKIEKSGVTPDSFSVNTPTTFRTAYYIPSDLDGTSTSPAIVLWGYPDIASLNRWKTTYGVTGTESYYYYGSSVYPEPDDSVRLEATMDLQMTYTAAPKSSPNFVKAASNYDSDLSVAIQGAVDLNSTTISNSWGGCENGVDSSTVQAFDTVFQGAAAKGIPIFFSSGDSGVFQCSTYPGSNIGYANFPGTEPLVTSVGGTALDRDTSTNAWQNETAWSCPTTMDSQCLQANKGSSGGGASINSSRPAYQASINPPIENKFTFRPVNTRLVPDISMDGDPATGQKVYGTYYGYPADSLNSGGTSASAPFLAGITDLAVQKRGGPVGSINNFIYNQFPADWGYDVTSGYTGVNAHPGWDYTTGLGSIKNASAFINAFVSNLVPAVSSVIPDIVPAGGPAFTLTVKGSNFHSDSTVNWNGSALATTYITPQMLSAAVPAGNISSAGTPAIMVVNPAPVGGTTNPVTVTVSPNCVDQVVNQVGASNSDSTTCGYLRYALGHTDATHKTVNVALSSGQIIALSFSGQPLAVPNGVTINGICSPTGPALTISGSATANNLVLNGGTTLFGLKFTGFGAAGQPKMKVLNSGNGANKLACTLVGSS